jgi:hypothetical protein
MAPTAKCKKERRGQIRSLQNNGTIHKVDDKAGRAPN